MLRPTRGSAGEVVSEIADDAVEKRAGCGVERRAAGLQVAEERFLDEVLREVGPSGERPGVGIKSAPDALVEVQDGVSCRHSFMSRRNPPNLSTKAFYSEDPAAVGVHPRSWRRSPSSAPAGSGAPGRSSSPARAIR